MMALGTLSRLLTSIYLAIRALLTTRRSPISTAVIAGLQAKRLMEGSVETTNKKATASTESTAGQSHGLEVLMMEKVLSLIYLNFGLRTGM